jgi:hypothetical protein
MKRLSGLFIAIMIAAAPAWAQGGNPMSDHYKAQWTNVRDLLVKMADKMPDADYRFKPTPEMQDFGQRVLHVATFNMRACAAVTGSGKTLTAPAMPTKAEATAALKEANAECDAVFNSLTDQMLMTKMVPFGRGGMRPLFAALEANPLEHAQEVYGYMAPYLRLKGLVPPSSDRNER